MLLTLLTGGKTEVVWMTRFEFSDGVVICLAILAIFFGFAWVVILPTIGLLYLVGAL